MKKVHIGILSPPMDQANVEPFFNLVDIIRKISNKSYVIAIYGKNTRIGFAEYEDIFNVIHEPGKNFISIVFKYMMTQFRISGHILKLSKNVNFWIFYMGDSLIMPMITAKILRKKVVLALGGSLEKETELRKNSAYKNLAKVSIFLKKMNLILSNRVILYSEKLIKEWHLEKYKNKICIAHKHFLDFNKFKITKDFDERDNLIAYIGRLSEEKGTLNFVKAIPELLKENSGIKILIGGDGQLEDEIKRYLDDENADCKVKVVGWIPHDELPEYLNELKLLVLPSFTEGLPNILLEAMACGTPVLAAPVGSIPDVIDDGINGIIMENNSPECIAENINRALYHSNLENISKNARNLVKKQFSFEKAVDRFKKITKIILKDC